MVLLTLFLLGGIDQAINPKSRQTIGRRVRLGLTDEEFGDLTEPFQGPKRKGKKKFLVKRRDDFDDFGGFGF